MNVISFPSPFIAQSSIDEKLHLELKCLYTEMVQKDLSPNKQNFADGDFKRFSSKANNYESEVWGGGELEDYNGRLAKQFQKAFNKVIEHQQFPQICVASKIDKVWWEFYEPYGYRPVVNYPCSDFTGIYVVDCQQHDVINFTSPLISVTSGKTHSPEIKDGDVLIAPSELLISSKTFTRKSLLFYFTIDCQWQDHGIKTKEELFGLEQQSSAFKQKSRKRLSGSVDDRVRLGGYF